MPDICNIVYTFQCTSAEAPYVLVRGLDATTSDPVIADFKILKGTLRANVLFEKEQIEIMGLDMNYQQTAMVLDAKTTYTGCAIGTGPAIPVGDIPPSCDTLTFSQDFLDLYDCVITDCVKTCCPA